MSAEKAALREKLLRRRRERPTPERAAAAAAVAATLVRRLAGVRTLAAYVPDDTEPGAGRLPDVDTQLGARVLLPVVPTAGTALTWAVDTGRLAPGRFGLLEPAGPRLGATALGAAEVIVAPALATEGKTFQIAQRVGQGR